MSTKSGFAFEGSGRLERVDTYTTKAGKDILTLVVRVEGTYPQLVPVKFFGRTADEASDVEVGAVVQVTGRLGGRDWNGKVYGDIVGESVEVVAEAPSRQQEMQGTGGGGGHARGWGEQPSDDDDPGVPF